MKGKVSGWVLLAALALTGQTAAEEVFDPIKCRRKRVDACGCHHVYGMRHCHPKRKSETCEAPVRAERGDAGASERSPTFSL